MSEPRWLSTRVVLSIHSDQVDAYGGSLGVRDQGLLDSALNRPLHRYHHEPESDLTHLAASYGFGIAKDHRFLDGNKRVAFQAMYVFLGLNGLRITAPEEEVVALMLSVASGEMEEGELAFWLRDQSQPR